MVRYHIRRLIRGAVLAIPLALACDSPFEPKGDGERIPTGLVIEQDVTSESTRFYSFVAGPQAVYAVYFQSIEGNILFHVQDSLTGSLVASVSATPNSTSGRLEDNPLASFGSDTQRVFRIVVQTFFAGASARFRFKIDQINTEPELVPVDVAVGDTVVGETIAPKVDIDRFVLMGNAGQEIVLVGGTPAPVGSGSVAFSLVDTAGPGLLGSVFADAGPPTLTSGRMRLPATRGYALYVGSVISNTYPRYSGAYRFWTYAINRAPEHRGAPIAFNTEIAPESIDREGDIDEFVFQANLGDQFNVFVQAPKAFQLEVSGPGGGAFAVATANAADTALYRHSTGRFSAFQTGTYVVRVLGSGSHQIADTGRYRVYVYAIDRQPEHVPAAIAVGDTVSGEQIELPGDIDEFTFSGTAGEEINGFFQAEDGSQETWLQLEVRPPAGTLLSSVTSVGTDTSLTRQATGTFVLPSTGTYRVRVLSASGYLDRARGPYRFSLYPINRAPESAPATLALGDSITDETIELPGDIDEFTFGVSQTTLAGFALTRTGAGLGPCLRVAVIADNDLQILNSGAPAYCGTTTEVTLGTGPFTLPAGSHMLRVEGTAITGSGYTGPYRVVTFPLDSLPESVAAAASIPDTISGEAIDRPGDYDVFTFSGRSGQHIDVQLQGLAAPLDPSKYWFMVDVRAPDRPEGLAFVSTPLSSASLDGQRTRRIDLPRTGVYRLAVYSGHTGQMLEEVGGYRAAIVTVPADPETVPKILVSGDSITSERLDTDEDVDEFVLTGSPGQEFVVQLFSGETQALTVVVYDTTSGEFIDGTPSFVARESTGRFRLPATGVVGVRVYSPRPCPPEIVAEFFGCGTGGPGAYFLWVVPINRAPESVSSTVAIGDTIDGEWITPRGDVDEFTVTGAQGQHLIAYIQTPQGSESPGLVLRLIDRTSGVVLGSVASLNPTAALDDQSTGPIELPYTGDYTIRVEGASDRAGAGLYRFKVLLQ